MTRILPLLVFHLVYLFSLLTGVVRGESHDRSKSMVRYFEFNITLQSINPDCSDHTSPVFLINNQMPGPEITANQGDKVVVLIRNQLARVKGHHHDVTLHFHGIKQYGSVKSDGVPYITQLPIQPGEEFTHEFRVINQAGTYFYHAHVGLQEETMFGPVIVYESPKANPEILRKKAGSKEVSRLIGGPFHYDDERTIILSEWWHRPPLEFEKFIMGSDFKFLPEANSILINGRTLHNSRHATVSQCKGYETVPVQSDKTYRMRIIGATAFRTLGFAIAKHNLTIIEVDGELVKPYTVQQLEVAPGQRFSVLLHTDKSSDDYSIQVVRRWSDNVERPTNGVAVLRYPEPEPVYRKSEDGVDARGVLRFKRPALMEAPIIKAQFESANEEKPYWIWSELQPYYGVDPVVHKPADKTIKLRSVENRLPDGSTRFHINGVSFIEDMRGGSKQPLLHDIINGVRPLPGQYDTSKTNGYDPNLRTYPINHFDIVDIVIQTTHTPGEPCRSHPWHTHGHSHWEIANGAGEYNEERDGDVRNVPTPLQKDLTMIYPAIDESLFSYENGTLDKKPVGCGWSKIRIVAVSSSEKNAKQ